MFSTAERKLNDTFLLVVFQGPLDNAFLSRKTRNLRVFIFSGARSEKHDTDLHLLSRNI